jgi:hypothetical protein
MPRAISDELKAQIRNSLVHEYQQQFGANYAQCFHKNLKPDPVPTIAQQYTVSQSAVKKIHASIKMIGYLTRLDLNPTPL